jgi:suppressor for copper-sensitivity B
LVVAILMVLMGLTLIARNRSPENKKRLASICIIIIILGAFWTPYKFTPSLIEINNSKQPYWQAFTPGIIPELIAQGKTIFVDITAEWCITCQINKATVLRSGQIQSLLKSGEVIAMQGDWTRPDAKITAYLESFNRFGIPFNAIYGPGAPQGLALPELLTKNIVLGGLKAASNGSLFTAK